MTNTKLFLLIGTSLSLIPGLTFAQCVATQDCATLGYTENSCSGGKGVKCPFGNKWACFKSDTDVCKDNGFLYTCSGGGYAGGKGPACGNQYLECICQDGYNWKNGLCKQITDGPAGNVYYCNSRVVGVKTSNMQFYVALKNFSSERYDVDFSLCSTLSGIKPRIEELYTIYNNKNTLNSLMSTYGGSKLSGTYESATDVSSGYYRVYYTLDIERGEQDTISWPAGYSSPPIHTRLIIK